MILSASNCFRIGLFKNSKHPNAIKESNPKIPIRDIFGPLGAIVPSILNFPSSYYLLTHNQSRLKKYLLLDNLQQTFQVLQGLKYSLIDENQRISNFDSNLLLDTFFLNYHFAHHDSWENTPMYPTCWFRSNMHIMLISLNHPYSEAFSGMDHHRLSFLISDMSVVSSDFLGLCSTVLIFELAQQLTPNTHHTYTNHLLCKLDLQIIPNRHVLIDSRSH